MKANADHTNDPEKAICQNIRGFVFLGTPHKGAHLTTFGRILALFGYWTRSRTTLLDLVQTDTGENVRLHESFMTYLWANCGVRNTLCVFETVPETLFGYPIIEVGHDQCHRVQC